MRSSAGLSSLAPLPAAARRASPAASKEATRPSSVPALTRSASLGSLGGCSQKAGDRHGAASSKLASLPRMQPLPLAGAMGFSEPTGSRRDKGGSRSSVDRAQSLTRIGEKLRGQDRDPSFSVW
eukprot:TRINITY_DN33386_c0_g3_i1.p1 TRINITY_DN33386_c0_g3~~TRINITY_DN33386_c0_g3_i1.p1  ORF type:complete len:124 (+),score=18.50 TRINITY_DN33386_c0_g3_i1:152-523(+)